MARTLYYGTDDQPDRFYQAARVINRPWPYWGIFSGICPDVQVVRAETSTNQCALALRTCALRQKNCFTYITSSLSETGRLEYTRKYLSLSLMGPLVINSDEAAAYLPKEKSRQKSAVKPPP